MRERRIIPDATQPRARFPILDAGLLGRILDAKPTARPGAILLEQRLEKRSSMFKQNPRLRKRRRHRHDLAAWNGQRTSDRGRYLCTKAATR